MVTLWEKLLFWKKKQKSPEDYKEDTHYRFVNSEMDDITNIELMIEGCEGVIYHYQQARVIEEGEFARLEFGYSIVCSGDHGIEELKSSLEFQSIMGDILSKMIMVKNEQIRTDNTEKSYLQ